MKRGNEPSTHKIIIDSRQTIKGTDKIVIEAQNVVLDDEYRAHHAGCHCGSLRHAGRER